MNNLTNALIDLNYKLTLKNSQTRFWNHKLKLIACDGGLPYVVYEADTEEELIKVIPQFA